MENSSITEEYSNYDAGIAAYNRRHYEMAIYDFEQRAVQGDPVAQFCLGFMYKHGKGVLPDLQRAIEWYTKAAEQGYAFAQNDLGVTLVRIEEKIAIINSQIENGAFVSQALEWFEKAAEQDNPTAQYNIAAMHFIESRYHFSENSKEANELFQIGISWCKKAVKHDYPPAQNELARIYLLGSHGVNQNLEKAMELYLKAAMPINEWKTLYKNGYVLAQHSLGTIYAEGIEVKQNYKEALKWYRKAAAQGHAKSQFSLGLLYYRGNGVNRDLKTSANWYQKAAEQGDAEAQTNLVRMYVKGEGISKNSEKAARLALEAAQQGAAIAQAYLGEAFEKEPNDLLQDNTEAYYWYSLALQNKASLDAAKDDTLAAKVSKALERVGKQLTKEQRDKINVRVTKWKPRVLCSSGTGFYISEKHLLTNAHVIRWKDSYNKLYEFDEIRNGLRYVEEKSGSLDLDADLALLVDERGNMDTATFRSHPLDLGEKVAVFGYPLSHVLSYRGNGTSGIVSGLSSIIDDNHPDNLFQHTAPTQGGNSGGPILDAAGNVVGVVVSSLNPDLIKHQNVNFAIKFNIIEGFLQRNNIIDYNDPISVVAKDIDRKDIYVKAGKFTTLISCYVNKGPEPLPLEEIGIDGLK